MGVTNLAGGFTALVLCVLEWYVLLHRKKAPFDISPKIEKWSHIKPKEEETTGHQTIHGRNIPANGYFDEKKILPGKLASTPSDVQNIQNLATQLQQARLLKLDYSGLGDREIMEQTTKTGKPVYASGPGTLIPYFEMRPEGNQLVVYAGINQADKRRVGTVSTVGLQNVADVRDQFELYLANATLVGGPFKVLGRTSMIEQANDFEVAVQLAYKHQRDRATANRKSTTGEGRRRARYSTDSTGSSATDEPMTRTSRYHH
ncbi:hypothetical protein L3X07_00535 [Levilactobacillus brevis]|nr:hypothetical protein [Levilactobacillus brevis]